MKKLAFAALSLLALAVFHPQHAKAQQPAPIVIAPTTETIKKPAAISLTAEQVAALQTALGTQGVTFQQGSKVNEIRVILKWDKDGAVIQGANVIVTFR